MANCCNVVSWYTYTKMQHHFCALLFNCHIQTVVIIKLTRTVVLANTFYGNNGSNGSQRLLTYLQSSSDAGRNAASGMFKIDLFPPSLAAEICSFASYKKHVWPNRKMLTPALSYWAICRFLRTRNYGRETKLRPECLGLKHGKGCWVQRFLGSKKSSCDGNAG